MDEKMLLEAMGKLMDEKLEPLQSQMADMQSRITMVEGSLDNIRASQLKVELEQYPRISAALDGIKGVGEKFAKLDRLESKVDGHSDRIFALESVIKAR